MPTQVAPIERFMSTVLVVIAPEQPLMEAARLMRLHAIRHLPVVKKGRLVGILSQRDVHLLETLQDVDPARVLVEEAMVREVYTVEPEEPIDRVALGMAERRIGTAVVAHGDKLLGLFTTTDALRALAAYAVDQGILGEAVPMNGGS
ncbi:MAG: CBS domain-containing protein [Planctomycetes bacterium]|nr:CBS domain-containing protein [Planctomycetota bacterium]